MPLQLLLSALLMCVYVASICICNCLLFVFVFVCCAQWRRICPAHVSASLPIDCRCREYSATTVKPRSRPPGQALDCSTMSNFNLQEQWHCLRSLICCLYKTQVGNSAGTGVEVEPAMGKYIYGKDWWPKGWRPEEASEAAPQ